MTVRTISVKRCKSTGARGGSHTMGPHCLVFFWGQNGPQKVGWVYVLWYIPFSSTQMTPIMMGRYPIIVSLIHDNVNTSGPEDRNHKWIFHFSLPCTFTLTEQHSDPQWKHLSLHSLLNSWNKHTPCGMIQDNFSNPQPIFSIQILKGNVHRQGNPKGSRI